MISTYREWEAVLSKIRNDSDYKPNFILKRNKYRTKSVYHNRAGMAKVSDSREGSRYKDFLVSNLGGGSRLAEISILVSYKAKLY